MTIYETKWIKHHWANTVRSKYLFVPVVDNDIKDFLCAPMCFIDDEVENVGNIRSAILIMRGGVMDELLDALKDFKYNNSVMPEEI